MRFDIVSLFPEFVAQLAAHGVVGRAGERIGRDRIVGDLVGLAADADGVFVCGLEHAGRWDGHFVCIVGIVHDAWLECDPVRAVVGEFVHRVLQRQRRLGCAGECFGSDGIDLHGVGHAAHSDWLFLH